MKKLGFAKRVLVLGCLLAFQQSAFADEVLNKAKQLMTSKKPGEAYTLLVPLQSKRAGEPEYDYLLGVAALDSGRPSEAVFALERFLAVNPNHGPARLEIARAYFLIGETTASRIEFETVKRQAPPDQVNEAIQKYLGAINQSASDAVTRIRGYIEANAGLDTNVNSATSETQIAIPLFGGALATLAPDSLRRRDTFIGGAAGISVRHALSPEWAVNASTNFSRRHNTEFNQFDVGSLDGVAGLTLTRGVNQYTGALQYQRLEVDHSGYRQTAGVLGQWQHSLDEMRQFTLYGQAMRHMYDGTQEIRNANRFVVGGAYSQAFDVAYAPIFYVGVYTGAERPSSDLVPHLGNNLAGLRIGGQISIFPNTSLVGSVSYEHRRYRAEEPGFLVNRRDNQADYTLAINYVPALLWTIKPEISRTRNQSNIVLNDFARTQYTLTIRRDFN